MGSVIYKQQDRKIGHHFLIPESLKKKPAEVSLFLFLFFSKKDCPPCIKESIEVLNDLPPQYCTAVIAPVEDLKNETELR